MESSGQAVVAEVREGDYGSKVGTIEPGGAEFIPLKDRHGRPIGLFATWMSPNLEFATVFLGVIAVLFLQLTVWQALAAAIIGNGLGAIAHGFLSARGPKAGVPQMVISRIPFGYRGNVLPAGINAIVGGIGWFAVNSVSGAFALASLTGIDPKITVLIVVIVQIAVAFLGHNFLQRFERVAFPFLLLSFILAFIWVIPNAQVGAAAGGGGFGSFLIVVGIFFGYAAGWNPYASDYTRYLPPTVSGRATGWWAGLGVFISCTALGFMGMLVATFVWPEDASPTSVFTGVMPGFVAGLVLLAIVIGSISANAINVYSGAMSFLTLGIKWDLRWRRALIAVVFGVLGTALAYYGLSDVTSYENFLLVIAYWLGPWLGVFFVDQILRRRHDVSGFMFDPRHNPWGGWIAMAIGMVVSILLFSNQALYVGLVPKAIPQIGDIAFVVGFIIAAMLYWVFFTLQKAPRDEALIIPESA